MLKRTILVVLLTQPLITLDAVGVEAPTAPDMLNTSAPAISKVAGFRIRLIVVGSDDIYTLACGDPPRNKPRRLKKSCASHRAAARCIAATGRMGYGQQYVRMRGRQPDLGPPPASSRARAAPVTPSRARHSP